MAGSTAKPKSAPAAGDAPAEGVKTLPATPDAEVASPDEDASEASDGLIECEHCAGTGRVEPPKKPEFGTICPACFPEGWDSWNALNVSATSCQHGAWTKAVAA